MTGGQKNQSFHSGKNLRFFCRYFVSLANISLLPSLLAIVVSSNLKIIKRTLMELMAINMKSRYNSRYIVPFNWREYIRTTQKMDNKGIT